MFSNCLPQTSALKMITAEEAVSCGRVEIGGRAVTGRQNSLYSQLGYCPQFDTVWPRISLQEHLQLFARIRGVPEEDIRGTASMIYNGKGKDLTNPNSFRIMVEELKSQDTCCPTF